MSDGELTNLPRGFVRCLQEIKWPTASERKLHADFLIKWGHPAFDRVAYIADGTKVTMRNPSRVSDVRFKRDSTVLL